MAVVRRQRVHLRSLLIEREREVLAVVDPEVAVEAVLQIDRVTLELFGELVVVPDQPCETRTAHLGVVRVPLKLAGRAGKPRRSEEHTSELQSRRDLVC